MKKIITGILVLMLVASTGCSTKSESTAEEGIYTAGTYTATANGMGEVSVSVTVDANSITEVVIDASNETATIGQAAVEDLTAQIMDAQSTEIDGVSGATITTTAVKEAVDNCLAQARGEEIETTATVTEQTADVIVVGGGCAGLSAAATAAEEGATVILLEANGHVGGSTALSGGHMDMIDEEFNSTLDRNDADLQKYLDYDEANFPDQWGEDLKTLKEQINEYLASDTTGKFDSIERVMVDHYLSGSGTDKDGNAVTLDYDLIRAGVDANMEINNWLVEEGGMVIQGQPYNQHGNTPEGTGNGLIEALNNIATSYETVDIQLNTTATDLLIEDGNVVGVKATNADGTEVIYNATCGVVLATGSFSSNGEMAAEYQNIGTGLTAETKSTNPDTNTGAGITMAEEAGAQLRDMQFMCTLVYGHNKTTTVGGWGTVAKASSLLVNANGERFTNEAKQGWMEGAKNACINNQPNGYVYAVGDQKMIDALNANSETYVSEMEEAGLLFTGDTIEEVAEKAGLDAETLKATIEAYNSYVDAGSDPDFGRDTFNGKVEEGKYIIAWGESCYHLTFGGLVIDTDGHVLDENNTPIESLFAAGDVVSGIEGITHISCECLTTAIYYGRVSGVNAYLNK